MSTKIQRRYAHSVFLLEYSERKEFRVQKKRRMPEAGSSSLLEDCVISFRSMQNSPMSFCSQAILNLDDILQETLLIQSSPMFASSRLAKLKLFLLFFFQFFFRDFLVYSLTISKVYTFDHFFNFSKKKLRQKGRLLILSIVISSYTLLVLSSTFGKGFFFATLKKF